jgi:aryl-alcohol dehydrogenase-like predicted oxidoreductase
VRYRDLGNTGISVSELGFGCGNVGGLMTRGEPGEQEIVIGRALDLGITYFDTAPSYGSGRSEESLGRALSALGAWDKIVVGTKVTLLREHLAHAARAVRDSLEASLARLGRDHVDLLQLHSRIGGGGERGIAAAEVASGVAEAMRAAKREGLARQIGLTGLGDTDSVLEVLRSGAFDTVQVYFNAVNPSAGFAGASGGAQDLGGLIDVAAANRMGVLNIRVLAAGAVSGSDERARLASPGGGGAMTPGGEFVSDVERAQKLLALSKEAGLDGPVELGLRFALAKGGISTILVGFSDVEQLEDAARWIDRGAVPADLVDRVVQLAR